MSVKVSVVVPVYNPGNCIDGCIRSMLDQSLPADEYEVLFIDDGSTDETPARLDKLADKHPQFRVIHIPNSGWPGKPRNIGVEHARGEYVQFLDQDDKMAPEALARLYALGSSNSADIVMGKVASDFRGVPHGVFRITRDKVTIHDFPLIDSLTPHKMFRRDFLREHGIAYPEGKRRLEDQLYMVRAYFPAKAVSILGDYTCYYYRKRADGKNAGSTRIEPRGYYGNLREVLDTVVANTEPGPFRSKLLRRFYRVEMLGRLSEPKYLKHDEAYRAELFKSVRELADDHMDSSVEAGLTGLLRLRSTLLRANRPADVLELARRASRIKACGTLDSLHWQHGGLKISFTTWFGHGPDAAEPLVLVRDQDRWQLDPMLSEGFTDTGVDVTDELSTFRVQVGLRNRENAVEWLVPAKVKLVTEDLGDGRFRPVLHGVATIDPQRLAGKRPLNRGIWDVWLRTMGAGLDRRMRLGADHSAAAAAGLVPALLGDPAQLVIPYLTETHDNLSLDVDRRGKHLGRQIRPEAVTAEPGDGWSVSLALPVATVAGTVPTAVTLELEDSGRSIPARLVPGEKNGIKLVATAPKGSGAAGQAAAKLPSGSWALSAYLDGPDQPATPLGHRVVVQRGRLHLAGTPRIGLPARTARRALRAAFAKQGLRRLGHRVLDSVPARTRRKIRAVLRRMR